LRFNNSVTPYEHESLYSVAFRLVRENYVQDFFTIFNGTSDTSFIYKKSCNYLIHWQPWEKTMRDLLESNGLDINQFVLNQYQDLLFGKEQTPSSVTINRMFLKNRTKFCPLCLKEAQYHRHYWDISYITACPVHSVQLVEKCPRCDKFFSMHEVMVGLCPCGQRLFNRDIGIPIENDDQLMSQKVTLGLMLHPTRNFNNGDIKLSSEEYFKLYFAFFSVLYALPSYENLKPLINGSRDIKLEIPLKVRLIIRNVESLVFINHLIYKLVAKPSLYLEPLMLSLSNMYGAQKRKKSKGYFNKMKIIKEALLGHKTFHQLVTSRRMQDHFYFSPMMQEKKADSELITRHDASKILNIHRSNIMELGKQGYLDLTKITKRNRTVNLLTKASVERYMANQKDVMNLGEVVNYLGLTYKDAERLMAGGVLRSLPITPGRKSEKLFYKQTIVNFAAKLTLKSKLIRTLPSEQWVDFHKATILLSLYISMSDFFQLIANHQLETKFVVGRPTFLGLYFKKADIMALRFERKNQYASEYGYTLKHAAQLLGTTAHLLQKHVQEHGIEIQRSKTKFGKVSYTFSKESFTQLQSLLHDQNLG
jgi:hypothetical protein